MLLCGEWATDLKHFDLRKYTLSEVKNRELPLHFTLLCYFLLFGLIILVVMWIFQSFLLEPFYTSTKKAAAEKSAKIIAESLEKNQNPLATIDNVASYNSLCVEVYDTSTAFFQKRYECNYASPSVSVHTEAHKVYSYYSSAAGNNGSCLEIKSENERKDGFFEEFQKDTATKDNADNFFWKKKSSNTAKIMTFGKILSLEDGTECFVLVSSVITPINNTIEIFKDQIFVISIVFIVLAVAISLYVSQRIARPISRTTKAAKELAKKNYEVEFDSKGYLEVQELNDTLNFAKKELAKNERLQRELIANISHDLRTPLTMITGYGEVMRDLPGENTAENIQIIIDEATRLSSLVNDLLDLSKLQSGAMELQKSVFCITDSFEAIFARYAKLKEQDGYNIYLEKCSERVFVKADELKISQVIYNLVNNAINYAGEDKTVIVTQQVIGKKVRINVTDHGEGIPADKLEYIWDRYYKVDKEHKRSVIGTGLGLSIVKSILNAHNARCGVTSTLGKGSTFWFELNAVKVEKNKEEDLQK